MIVLNHRFMSNEKFTSRCHSTNLFQVATEREGLISGGIGGRDLVIGSRPYHRQGDDVDLRNLNIQNAYEQEDHLPDDPNYDKLIERKKIVAR